MSLVRTVTAGALVGSVAALGIFVSVSPDDMGRAAAPAAPTFAPVPTPTVTQLADCTPPEKLKKGICVTTKVVSVAPAGAASTPAATSAPSATARSAATATAKAKATAPAQQPRDPRGGNDDDREDD